MINKRYKDILDQYIHKGEKTPLTLGVLVLCAFCFLLLIVSTFTQVTLQHPWLKDGFEYFNKIMVYSPQVPVVIFIIYLLGKGYSTFVFLIYLIVGFFIWPIFAFGGGFEYMQNYLFGHILGYIFAIFIAGFIFEARHSIRNRLLGALFGVLTIHFISSCYCILLAFFGVINFSLIFPIIKTISLSKIFYDLIISTFVILLAPYIKNVFWICMKPSPDKKLKNSRPRN